MGFGHSWGRLYRQIKMVIYSTDKLLPPKLATIGAEAHTSPFSRVRVMRHP